MPNMLFLRILDAMNAIAENFTETVNPNLSYVDLKVEKLNRDKLVSASRSIVNSLADTRIMEVGDNMFVVSWDCFIMTVKVIKSYRNFDMIRVSGDLCDEVPWDFD